MENFKYFAPYIVSVVAMLGWLVSYALVKKHELKKRKLDVRIEPLIIAYKSIEKTLLSPENLQKEELCNAVSDIYLFGSGKQIRKLNLLLEQLDIESSESSKELLIALRREIRKELGMEPFNDAPEVDLIGFSIEKPNKRVNADT